MIPSGYVGEAYSLFGELRSFPNSTHCYTATLSRDNTDLRVAVNLEAGEWEELAATMRPTLQLISREPLRHFSFLRSISTQYNY